MEAIFKISRSKSLASAALILVFASSLAIATDSKCDSICGKVKETKNAMDKVMAHQDKNSNGIQTRIINGYPPPERPFMALLLNYVEGYKDEEMDVYSTCGGSVINNRFVMTAAHCVCLPENVQPSVQCTEDNKLEWDWKEKLKVYIGLHVDDDVKKPDLRKKYKNDVKQIIVYPGWKGSKGLDEEDGADLALVKLTKKLKWDRAIMPICLPKVEKLDVPDNKAYVAGWGRNELEERAKGVDRANCVTDNRGPGRNKKCRFPFTFKSPGVDSTGVDLMECEKGYFPSDKNSKCKQFLDSQGKKFDWNKTQHVVIWYNMKKDSTVCYSTKGMENGWCGVCNDEAKPGEEGYCPSNMNNNEAEQGRDDDPSEETLAKEMVVTQVGKKWGYCSPECSKEYEDMEKAPKILMETIQTVFNNKECNIMARLASDDAEKVKKNEVCAGLKFKFPKYKEYNRKFVKKSSDGKNEYEFIFMKEGDNYLGYPKEIQKLGYYIGYSDSCEGDSGGPLFQFVGGKAVQRGVVSRGSYSKGGCAISNAPGIYTQVYSSIKWIMKESKSGSC